MPKFISEFIDIQHGSTLQSPVDDQTLAQWIHTVLPQDKKTHHLTIRLVDPEEMITLNNTYRKQNKPTNVLAFPSSLPPELMKEYPHLGDIVICPDVLMQESTTQQVALNAHWAHILIHGVLHLLGHDHQAKEDTALMQELEIVALTTLGFNNPYT